MAAACSGVVDPVGAALGRSMMSCRHARHDLAIERRAGRLVQLALDLVHPAIDFAVLIAGDNVGRHDNLPSAQSKSGVLLLISL
jgi:hypothetical protein